jgi:predicted DNA-binding transcriptional regulator AlpA
MDTTPAAPEYLTHTECADLIRRTPTVLRQMNYRKVGPPRIKVGKRVIYPRVEVIAWLESQRVA